MLFLKKHLYGILPFRVMDFCEMKELFCKVCGTRILTICIIFLRLFSDSSCKIDRIRQEGQYQCIISGNTGEYTSQIEGKWKTEFDMN